VRVADVAIVGAGPAGIATAIQLHRSGVRPLLFDAGRPGGLLWEALLVENYPGFPRGISGPRLARRMHDHLRRVGGVVHRERVERLSLEEGISLLTKRGSYEARIVVIATGTRPRPIDGFEIPPEAESAVSRHVWPLRRVHGRTIAIVGAGDAAYDYALNLARRNDVIILSRSETPRALPLLVERAAVAKRIRIVAGRRLSSVTHDGRRFRLSIDGETIIAADFLIPAIGREPELGLLSSTDIDRRRELVAAGRLHIIGDAVGGRHRQTTIAVGDGVRAAMGIAELLDGSHDADR
jgi:thioredoxin reductase (NADPH)